MGRAIVIIIVVVGGGGGTFLVVADVDIFAVVILLLFALSATVAISSIWLLLPMLLSSVFVFLSLCFFFLLPWL